MNYERDRGGRQQQFHGIGEEGRMTGIRPPKNVPRDSSGMEDPAAFMNSRQSGASSFGRPSLAHSAGLNSPRHGPRMSISPSKAGRGGRERPDLYVQDGERGRKTGVTVPQQQRDEYGFEDLGAYFGGDSPTTVKKARQSAKKATRSPINYDDDDDDEDDGGVEYVEPDVYSPSTHVAQGLQRANGKSTTSSSLRKVAATANGRRSPSPSDESEEEVRRITIGNKSSNQSALNRSTSSVKQMSSRRALSSSGSDDEPQAINEPLLSSEEEQSAPRGKKDSTNANNKSRASRGSLGSPVAAPSRKGKERARSPEPEPEEEGFFFGDDQQDYGGGGDDYESDGQGVPFGVPSDVEEEDEEQQQDEDEQPQAKAKSKKKVTSAPKVKAKAKSKSSSAKERAAPAPKRKAAPRSRSVQPEPIIERKHPRDDVEDDDDGIRRSHRQRVMPVEYWRNERVIYKRRASGMGMEAVVKIPKAETESLTFKKKASNLRGRGDSVRPSRGGGVKDEVHEEEEGVDDLTDPDGIVWSWEGNAETTRRIAFTGKMIDPRPTHNNKFMFQKIFTELDYLASGILQIPSGAEKPSKAARDNSYTFYCIQGSVSVVVHRSRFNIGPGGTFFVPRGNSYSITAISNRDVKLFFTQARRVFEGPDGETRPDTQEEALARLEAEQEEEQEEADENEDEDEEESD